MFIGKIRGSGVWWLIPVVATVRRPRQEDHCESEGSSDHTVSSRPVWAAGRCCLRKQKRKERRKREGERKEGLRSEYTCSHCEVLSLLTSPVNICSLHAMNTCWLHFSVMSTELLSCDTVLLSFYSIHTHLFWPEVLSPF